MELENEYNKLKEEVLIEKKSKKTRTNKKFHIPKSSELVETSNAFNINNDISSGKGNGNFTSGRKLQPYMTVNDEGPYNLNGILNNLKSFDNKKTILDKNLGKTCEKCLINSKTSKNPPLPIKKDFLDILDLQNINTIRPNIISYPNHRHHDHHHHNGHNCHHHHHHHNGHHHMM